MNPHSIRLKSIDKIRTINGQCEIKLPLIDKINTSRTKEEICGRINAMHLLYTIGNEPENKAGYFEIIKENSWETFLSNEEVKGLNRPKLSGNAILNFQWYKESIKCLLWSVSAIEHLEIPVEEDFLSNFFHLMPPEKNNDIFLSESTKRNNEELATQIDLLYCYHWCTKHFYEKDDKDKIISIIRERRTALEWVINPTINWDNISLDT